jgi:hypothetical protein
VLTAGRLQLTEPQPLGGLYDAQAHALLEGHWHIPPEGAGIEGIVVDGRTYMYFGPFPAVLRMPVAAVTDRFDGRLAVPAMLLAFAVLAVAVGRLSWTVRSLIRGHVAIGAGESIVMALATFAACASVPLFLASRPIVYHEALLWGVAWAVAAYDQLLRFVVAPSVRRLAATTIITSAALLSRPPVGAGPVAVLVLVAAITLLPQKQRWLGLPPPVGRRFGVAHVRWWPLLAAALLPVALSVTVNVGKFGTAFEVPFDKHVVYQAQPTRRATLERNGGSILGLQFLPTAAVHYLRPDAIELRRSFPWVNTPTRIKVLGDVEFDSFDRSASLPPSMPAATLLAIAGFVAVWNPRRRSPSLAPLRLPVIGGLAGFAAVLIVAHIANRYLVDGYPMVLIPALAGLHLGMARARRLFAAGNRRRRLAALAAGTLLVLALVGVWVNLALALWYQGSYGAGGNEALRERFIELQQRIDDRIVGGPAPDLRTGVELPTKRKWGDLFVAGPCAALYWSSGGAWYPVEVTPVGGQFELRVRLERSATGRQPLVVVGAGTERLVVTLERVSTGRAVVAYRYGSESWREGSRFALDGAEHTVEVLADPRGAQLSIRLDGTRVAGSSIGDRPALPRSGDHVVGRASDVPGVAPRLAGTVRLVAEDADLCRFIRNRR